MCTVKYSFIQNSTQRFIFFAREYYCLLLFSTTLQFFYLRIDLSLCTHYSFLLSHRFLATVMLRLLFMFFYCIEELSSVVHRWLNLSCSRKLLGLWYLCQCHWTIFFFWPSWWQISFWWPWLHLSLYWWHGIHCRLFYVNVLYCLRWNQGIELHPHKDIDHCCHCHCRHLSASHARTQSLETKQRPRRQRWLLVIDL